MTPTDTIRLQLRRLLDEAIPPGETDAVTAFPNAEIDELLTLAPDNGINQAAYWGWVRKAARAMSGAGAVAETQVGTERVRRTSLTDLRAHSLDMAKIYLSFLTAAGTKLMYVDEPDVLHLADYYSSATLLDISRGP